MFSNIFTWAIRLAFSALLVIVLLMMGVIGVGFIEAFIAEPMRFFNG